MTEQKNLVKQETLEVVEKRIAEFQQNGQLHFPANYSPQNALKQAWLLLQEVVDKDKKPALTVCTKASIANALLDMVVQALSPVKKQCYFIVYGNKLTCQRSYFGTMAVTKRLTPGVADIVAETIHEGDEVTIVIDRGRKDVESHKQKFGAADKPIIGAYCRVLREDGSAIRTEVMTLEQIKQAWKQSKMNPVSDKGVVKEGSTHQKFMTEMAKKTVINRCCKPLLNSSDDSDLVIQAVNRADEMRVDDEVEAEIGENAQQDFIDITPDEPAVAAPCDQADCDNHLEGECAAGHGKGGPECSKYRGAPEANGKKKPGF